MALVTLTERTPAHRLYLVLAVILPERSPEASGTRTMMPTFLFCAC